MKNYEFVSKFLKPYLCYLIAKKYGNINMLNSNDLICRTNIITAPHIVT